MPPAARVSDLTAHGSPLAPGPGSANVLIGFLPAWRGVPAAAVPALQAAQTAANTAMRTAEAATVAAAGTPGAPAAKLAEETLKASLAVSMGAMMSAFAGMSDIHICPVPVPIPPHGPGVVIDGEPTVLINNMPACRQGDTVLEALGGPDKIAMGCFTVLIGSGSSSALSMFPSIPGFAAISGMLDKIKEAVMKAMQAVIDAFNQVVDMALKAVNSVIDKIAAAAKSAIQAIKKYINEFLGKTAPDPAILAADKKILETYGDYIPDAQSAIKASDVTHYQSKSDFVEGFQSRWPDYTGDPNNINGESYKGNIFINKDQANGGTFTHEAVHHYGSNEYANTFYSEDDSLNLNEGTTELFTRKVYEGQDRAGIYEDTLALAQDIESEVGEETMKNAFFKGDSDAISEVQKALDSRTKK